MCRVRALHGKVSSPTIFFLFIFGLFLGGYLLCSLPRATAGEAPNEDAVQEDSKSLPPKSIFLPALVLNDPEENPKQQNGDAVTDVQQFTSGWIGDGATDLEGGVILIGQRIEGIIDDAGDADVYEFQGLAGESVAIGVNAASGGLDPAVTLFMTTQNVSSPPPAGNAQSAAGAPDDEIPRLYSISFAQPLLREGTNTQPRATA